MVYYIRHGEMPESRHTYTGRDKLLREELFGLKAFDGEYSLLYHLYDPAEVESISREDKKEFIKINESMHRHIKTMKFKEDSDFFYGRMVLFLNDEISIGIIRPEKNADYYFRNAVADELFFVHNGSGEIISIFGRNKYRKGDFIFIPRGTTYKINISENSYFFFIVSKTHIKIPHRYLNEYGQIKEGYPYYDRDFNVPEFIAPETGVSEYNVKVDYGDYYMNIKRFYPLFDVAGWDGYLYPFTLNIDKMAPIVGKLHMPPPVHETFESDNFMVGSFLPRPFDFHEKSIPIPYYHNNINSDEIIFYSSGNFMSRRGIETGSITLHVHGMIHGPQPGLLEKSICQKGTDEVAIMVETYKELYATELTLKNEEKDYYLSWKK